MVGNLGLARVSLNAPNSCRRELSCCSSARSRSTIHFVAASAEASAGWLSVTSGVIGEGSGLCPNAEELSHSDTMNVTAMKATEVQNRRVMFSLFGNGGRETTLRARAGGSEFAEGET